MTFIVAKLIFAEILTFGRPLLTQNVKFISLVNDICIAKPTLINLIPDELGYYPSFISSDRYHGSCNNLDEVSGRT